MRHQSQTIIRERLAFLEQLRSAWKRLHRVSLTKTIFRFMKRLGIQHHEFAYRIITTLFGLTELIQFECEIVTNPTISQFKFVKRIKSCRWPCFHSQRQFSSKVQCPQTGLVYSRQWTPRYQKKKHIAQKIQTVRCVGLWIWCRPKRKWILFGVAG